MTRASHRQQPTGGQPRPIRVLVVDDSVSQRAMLVALLQADPALVVAGWAADGAEAVQAAVRLKPDVITMDLRMPGMDGLEATRRIMQEAPVPIVLVTASAAREDQRTAFEALEAGVLAIVAKPVAEANGSPVVLELLRTVKSMAQVKVVRRWPTERLRRDSVSPVSPAVRAPTCPPDVVAIGASAGGPQALQELLPRLPATFPLPVLLVQHIAPGFVYGLIEWLRPQCAQPIRLVDARVPLDRPGIYVAPPGWHLLARGRALVLTDDPLVSGHRPSATVLFQSVAREYGPAAIGILLSGMGEDGAAGLRDLKRAGAITIAQDEGSSVVFGMPAAAIGMGVVDHVMRPAEIAPLLVQWTERRPVGRLYGPDSLSGRVPS